MSRVLSIYRSHYREREGMNPSVLYSRLGWVWLCSQCPSCISSAVLAENPLKLIPQEKSEPFLRGSSLVAFWEQNAKGLLSRQWEAFRGLNHAGMAEEGHALGMFFDISIGMRAVVWATAPLVKRHGLLRECDSS